MNAPLRGYTLDFIQRMLTQQSGRASGWFRDLELKSVFQPAFCLPQKHAVGFEASLRGMDPNGNAVSPETLFGPVENYSEMAMLDMLSATIHVHNFFSRRPSHGVLSINLHPEVFLDFGNSAGFLTSLFSHYEVAPQKVMIDIAGSVLGHERLDDAIASYRSLGCLISVDHFGVDNANLDSIWHTAPAIVKIGPSVVAEAMKKPRTRQILPRAVSLLHEMGTLVLMEGLESEDQALLAIDVDADFGSGYFFGQPVDGVTDFSEPDDLLNKLWNNYREQRVSVRPDMRVTRVSLENETLHSSHADGLRKASPSDIARYRQQRHPYLAAIQNIAAQVRSGVALETSSDAFLGLEGALRCFLLDGSGSHLGADIFSASPPPRQSADFYSMGALNKSDWSRRDFFRRAIHEPEVVQATRQYCSLTGYLHCVTFSMATRAGNGKPVVICGDVDWSTHARIQ
ncbi:MAG: EAL domain-containing protein [Betaproteobacteria bacterium]|nr:EAL domain-containing protein [Betaproteobacteria bacterium]